MKETNVHTLIIFRTTEEIPKNMIMNQLDVSFGTFQMKLSLLKGPAVKWECHVKSVMAGCSNVIILLNIIPKEVNP